MLSTNPDINLLPFIIFNLNFLLTGNFQSLKKSLFLRIPSFRINYLKIKKFKNYCFLNQPTSTIAIATTATPITGINGDFCVSAGVGGTVPNTDGTVWLTFTDCAFSA